MIQFAQKMTWWTVRSGHKVIQHDQSRLTTFYLNLAHPDPVLNQTLSKTNNQILGVTLLNVSLVPDNYSPKFSVKVRILKDLNFKVPLNSCNKVD